MDPLSILERKDKWFLGGGKGAIYAPPFPKHLHAPGFWDECYLADIRLTRLFTVLFCDFSGKPIRLSGQIASWRPDRLVLDHYGTDIHIRETRLVTEQHEWVSVFELVSGKEVHAFLWSLPEMRAPGYGAPWQSLNDCWIDPNSISYKFATAWPSELEPDRSATEDERVAGKSAMLEPLTLDVSLVANQPRLSLTVNLAQRHDDSPLWETSLLPQKLRGCRLPGDFKLNVGPPPVEGLVHIIQQYELRVGEPLVVWARASLPSASAEMGRGGLGPDVVKQSERAWNQFFGSVPQFNSSDPFLTAAYWYRWYGLRLNTVDMTELPICRGHSGASSVQCFSPFVTEGVGFFRNFVTYSAQAHLREVSWMHSPRLGQGILDNLSKCQREDGSFPGHNYSCRPARDFYHADFATGARQLASLHGLDIKPHFRTLASYAEFLSRRSVGNWVKVLDQNETGQEYMSRYAFASETADQWSSFEVLGVEATVYFYLLKLLLRDLDPDSETVSPFDQKDGHSALLSMLDEDFFCDMSVSETSIEGAKEPCPGTKSWARPATGFYPALLPDLGELEDCNDAKFTSPLTNWLVNPEQFWLPKGFPATALSDPTFSCDAEWKEKRLNCPWNGRSWPMVNSHLVDALANVARRSLPSAEDLRIKAGEALVKAITLMFHDGDPARPNSYEHYDPFTGTPSLYRGYDDYMHSWIVDLILRHAVGVQPGEDAVDPLPLGVDWIECTDIPHTKGRMNVRIERDRVVKLSIES